MSGFIASAPGKVFLSGEYAVLEGAPAVLAAIDRRAHARESKASPRTSPVIDAVMAEISARRPDLYTGEGAAAGISVRTPGFARGRAKLGLGSSAAVAAAATALMLARAEGRADVPLSEILEVALAAHKRAQGGRGSGADVAVSVHGGVILFRIRGALERIDVLPVAAAFAWTGRSASTTELVARIQVFAQRAPEEHRAQMRELGGLADELASAYALQRAKEIVRLTSAYGIAMERLGEASGAPIVTEIHARVAALARESGGAGKPSGAGGGDLAMAVFADLADRDRFCKKALAAGIPLVDLRCSAPGVEIAARP